MDSEIRCLTATTRRATIARGGKLAAVLGFLSAGVWSPAAEAKNKHKKHKKKKKTVNLRAELLGTNEVPGTGARDPNASGSCTFTVKGSQICGTFSFQTTPSSPIFGTHIHRGATGVNGDIVVSFGIPTLGSPVCVTCPSSSCSDSTILSQITSNPPGFYCNIHTNAFPNGAARGQLVKG